MNKFKITFSSILIIAITLGMSIPINAYATNNIEQLKDNEDKIVSEKVITNSEKIQEYCKQKQIPFIENDKEISKIVIIEETEKDKIQEYNIEEPQTTPYAVGDVYKKESPMQWTSSKYCAIAKGSGPSTLYLSTSYSESATVSASFSYSASNLTAAVGFSVTNNYTISPSYSVNLSSGQYATIYAYPIYKGYYFKKINMLTGSVNHGTAYRPIGASYEVVYR